MSELKKNSTVSVIICVLNEEENLPKILPKIPDYVSELIFVDGHSTDRTIDVIKQLCPSAKIIIQTGKGKGNALKEGIKEASSDIIITLDADGATDPADMPKYLKAINEGYDFAKGTRFMNTSPVMPAYRKFGNWILASATNTLFGSKYTDVCSGYNAFRKETFLKLNLVNDDFEMEQEMIAKASKLKLKVIEIQQRDPGRMGSVSKVSGFKQGFKDLWTIIKERF